MQDSRNYYQILEVSQEATAQEIKKSYRRLARQYHPDLHPENPVAAERFKEICQAYEILSNPLQRREYDKQFKSSASEYNTSRITAKDFYVRAVAKAAAKDYQGAIADFNQALKLNPTMVEAYVERGASHYKLGNARSTLQDCNQALSINPKYQEAYYYQGRARDRLGYTQAAREAYTSAIAIAPNFAEYYYHRGLANKDLQEYDNAIYDLQKAAELFSKKKDHIGYQLAQESLKILIKTQGKQKVLFWLNPLTAVTRLIADTIRAFQVFALNPAGGLLPSFSRLGKQQAVAVGITLAAIFNISFILGAYWGWRDLFQLYLFKLMLVGIVPFVTLVVIIAIARLIFRSSGSIAGDIFIAGAALIPLSLLVILSGISTLLGSYIMIIMTVFASCYTILILYNGCTQIANLSETTATLLVPAMLLLSGWFSYLVISH